MSFDRADQGKTETIGKDAGAGRTDSQVKQSLEGCRVKLVSIFFYVIITQVFPFSKDNTDAYGEHLSPQRKCTCAEDNTRWIYSDGNGAPLCVSFPAV